LLKIEKWDILDQERRVIYIHPASSGSTSLVYPVKIEPRTTFYAALAMAPEAWTAEGDGVVFSMYVEDHQGTQQIFSKYINPKQNLADQCWHVQSIDISAYIGQTITLIFETDAGLENDLRYDWAGWGFPRLLVIP
jgi:hypothetical protein